MTGADTMARPLTAAERAKLVGILGRLGSDFDGERAAAGLLASRLLRDRGLSWDDVIHAPGSRQAHRPPCPEPPPAAGPGTAWRDDLAFCQRHMAELDEWPADFVASISAWRKSLSPEQVAKLAQIARKLRAQGFA